MPDGNHSAAQETELDENVHINNDYADSASLLEQVTCNLIRFFLTTIMISQLFQCCTHVGFLIAGDATWNIRSVWCEVCKWCH